MIVKISQTASNIKQTYDVQTENGYYRGETGRMSRWQTITLSNEETTLYGAFNAADWFHYIPFSWLFCKETRTRVFDLYRGANRYGSIAYLRRRLFKNRYVIALDSGEVFDCYFRSKGTYDYVSIYQGDKQIGLIETYLITNDLHYLHKLYILDEYNEYADTLALFVLYYANYHFAKRFHMSSGSQYVIAWSFSGYNKKYDAKWRETHFPDENYWGKLNLYQ